MVKVCVSIFGLPKFLLVSEITVAHATWFTRNFTIVFCSAFSQTFNGY